ncbi:MAG TPA: hypothetical protein VNG51_16315 [Ktedonobacteraceae bacterium]|nr:hypothetical protein [Ktedonobacteraceae bacterium]
MGNKELEESQRQDDDFEIEVIDLDALAEELEPAPESPRGRYGRNNTDETIVPAPVRVSLRSKLTRRQRIVQIAASAAVIIVALVLILNSIVPVRSLLHLVAGPTPGPTPTPAPNIDHFYLDASPPWGNLTLDGNPLTFSTIAPIQLARGRHQFVWQASPFHPIRCTLSVPLAATDTCTHITIATQVNGSASTAQEVTFYDTLNMLSGTQQAALIQAAQTALDAVQSTTTVQPGEQFVHFVGNQTTDIATQPLHATLHFSLSVGNTKLENAICASHYSSECDTLYRFQSQNVTQNCAWFCTDPDSYTNLTVPNYWQAIVIAHEYWDFTTLDGHTIATNQPDTTHDLNNSAHLLFLNILWDGKHWQATFDALQASGYNTLGCLAANNELNQMPPPVGLNGFGFSANPATVPADGCLEVVQSTAANPSSSVPVSPPQALCLYRFGLMLAANALAHHYWPSIPLANPYEQSLAKHLTAPAPL